jgi:pyruvate carboxylase
MLSKLLVANRGEIAIRAFRAAYELGIDTVAVYAFEDRNSLHRLKADESYQIGAVGHPVRAYLSVDEIIRAARHAGADAVYPGYGFLSESSHLASACADAGITFVGPSASVLELTGNKTRAIAAARDAGLPVLASSAPSASIVEVAAAGQTMRLPLFPTSMTISGTGSARTQSSSPVTSVTPAQELWSSCSTSPATTSSSNATRGSRSSTR